MWAEAGTTLSLLLSYSLFFFLLQASEELEDRESLAVMAASGLQANSDANNEDESNANDSSDVVEGDAAVDAVDADGGMDFMEQYTQGVSAVETILALDRLRQSVAVKELLRNGVVAKVHTTAGNNASSSGAALMASSSSSQAQQSQFMRKTVSVPNFSHVRECLSAKREIRTREQRSPPPLLLSYLDTFASFPPYFLPYCTYMW